jgi:hypothetical protein
MEGIKQYGIMRSYEDKEGNLYLSVDDIIKHLDLKRPVMTKVQQETLTADSFIKLLRRYAEEIRKLP